MDVNVKSSTGKPTRILVVDDHPVVRKGITSCLARNPDFEIVGEAADGPGAISASREHRPDVVLLDIDMPGQNGLSVAEVLRAEFPDTKVIILSMLTSEGYVSRVLSVGVDGCIPKHAPVEDLEQAIHTVARGETYFHSDVAKVAVKSLVRNGGGAVSPSQLTQREREVLIHVAEGLSNKEIASQLGLGVRTVETHRDRLMRKLCIHSVAGLTKFAIRHGLVSLEAEHEPRTR